MLAKTPEDLFYEGLLGLKLRKEAEAVPSVKEPAPESEDKTQQLIFRQVSKSNLFSHPEAHPYVLDLALIKTFNLEWFEWEPDTVFQEIKTTFNTSIADINRVKIMATMTLHIIDTAWEHWEVFESTIQALNGVIPNPSYMNPCDVPFLMAGVDIINDIRKEEFNDEIGRYVAACFMNEEVSYAPPPLDFSQPYLSQLRYRCAHCGKHGSALPPFNGHCDSCSAKFQHEHPFNFKSANWAKDDTGDIHYYMELDFQDTKKRFDELVGLPANKISIQETPTDIETAKLISAHDYMELRRKQKNQQLTDLKTWLGAP